VPSDGRTVRVDLPPLSDLPDIPAPPPPAAIPSPPAAPTPQPSAPPRSPAAFSPAIPRVEPLLEDHGGFQRGLGWLFVGAAAVGLGVGAYFGMQWLDENSLSQSHCHAACDPMGAAAQSDARRDAKSGETAAGAGGAALLVGTLLVLTAPGPRLILNNASIDVAPIPPTGGAGRGGVVVRGFW
jgi:hypothetical protein